MPPKGKKTELVWSKEKGGYISSEIEAKARRDGESGHEVDGDPNGEDEMLSTSPPFKEPLLDGGTHFEGYVPYGEKAPQRQTAKAPRAMERHVDGALGRVLGRAENLLLEYTEVITSSD